MRGELLVLDDVGPARRSRAGTPIGTVLVLTAPAAALLLLVAAWPAGTTIYDSFVGEHGRFVGADNYGSALRDPQFRTDLWNTGLWAVVVPVLLTVLGYALAALTRRARSQAVFSLVLAPMALSLLVTGVTFRLLYDPSPDRGPITAVAGTVAGLFGLRDAVPLVLGPTLVNAALMSAFVWAWVGLAVAVFRTALDAIPPELEDAVRSEGGDSMRVLRDVQWPYLRRVAAILVLVFAVVASRTFDLVLVMAPDPVQHRAEVLALYLLRQPDIEAPGGASAVGVMWLVVVVVGSMLAARGARHDWPWRLGAARGTSPRRPRTARWTRRPGRAAAAGRASRRVVLVLAIAAWALPVLFLVLTSLHERVDQAVRGWRAPLSTASYAGLPATLWEALVPTALMALGVTVVVVVAGGLAAYALAWLNPPGSRVVIVVLLVAAVVPIQVIARPLHSILFSLGIQGTALVLAIVHIGRGLPFAVLVLRNSFAAVPADRVRQARLRTSGEAKVLATVVAPRARPALVAVAALEFVLVWNDFVVGFLFGGPGFTPVGVVLFSMGRQFVSSASALAAGSIVASIVPLVVILLARRWIVTGLISGVALR